MSDQICESCNGQGFTMEGTLGGYYETSCPECQGARANTKSSSEVGAVRRTHAFSPGMTTPRVICPGWAGVHSEPIVLREGSEPVSHGMCKKCCAAWVYRAGIESPDVVCSDQAHETGNHDLSTSS